MKRPLSAHELLLFRLQTSRGAQNDAFNFESSQMPHKNEAKSQTSKTEPSWDFIWERKWRPTLKRYFGEESVSRARL